METEQSNGILTSAGEEARLTVTELRGSQGSAIQTFLALILWLGSIHLNFVIVLASFLFLSLPMFLLFVISLLSLSLLNN